jgi:hypothetical protein
VVLSTAAEEPLWPYRRRGDPDYGKSEEGSDTEETPHDRLKGSSPKDE